MASSTVEFKYGDYVFNPTPQIGVRNDLSRLGRDDLGAADISRIISVRGVLNGANYEEIEHKWNLLDAALSQSNKVLLWSSERGQIINQTVQPLSWQHSEQWGQFDLNYSVSFKYKPLGITHNNPFAVTLGGYSFNPTPTLAREYSVVRNNEDGPKQSRKTTIRLSGTIDKGSQVLNEAEIASILAEMNDSVVLTYGSWAQTVRCSSFSIPDEVGDRVIGFTITAEYDDDFATADIKRCQSSFSVTRNTQRLVVTKIPFVNGGAAQLLGDDTQKISANGFCVGTSLAAAEAQALVEIASVFPSNGLEHPGSTITKHPAENKVEWNITREYMAAPLTGGIYG